MERYFILCVAGQSNAVGYDESCIPSGYVPKYRSPRIMQLGFYGDDNLHAVPLGACAQNFQDLRPFGHDESAEPGTRGIHLPLASLLLPLIPDDAVLLVLPCAYGGTGFTSGDFGKYDDKSLKPEPGVYRWGKDSPYYQAMRDRISMILDASEENCFFRMVWCQGEQDVNEPEGHRRGFQVMAEDFLSYFGQRFPNRVYQGDWNRNCWLNMETTRYWHDLPGCQRIWNAYREWNPDTYVEIPRDTDTNAVNGTGKTSSNRDAHFGNDAYARVIAPRVAAKIRETFAAI